MFRKGKEGSRLEVELVVLFKKCIECLRRKVANLKEYILF